MRRAYRSLALCLVFFAALSSCAVQRLSAPPLTTPTALVAPLGPLSPTESTALLKRELGPAATPTKLDLIDAFRSRSSSPLITGNHVQLLVDGPQTFAAIRKAIAQAKHHIHVETYIFADDELGRSFAALLIQRRREGIEVRVLYDAIGSVTTPSEMFTTMREAGIDVLAFRPLNPVRTPLPWQLHNRDHRKIIVIDGRTAFTGGINVSSTYSSSSRLRPGPEEGREAGWRDTHLQITGPVVIEFQTLFFDTWVRAGGSVDRSRPEYFPKIPASGNEIVAATASDGTDHTETAIYATYLAAIEHASERVWLTQAYFAPDKQLRRALITAAKRGVDVRLIVPGFTDSSLIFYASRSTYEDLLRGGVKIYEQRHALLHAKSAVFDGVLGMVGSANLDMRSFLHNNEVNAVIVGREFGRELEQLFERDLIDARELKIETWRTRPLSDRFKEAGSRLFWYWL